MPRSESRTKTSIWIDEDFKALSKDAQRMYWLLYSQPTILLCGVVAYTPKRWASFASDDSTATIILALAELEENRFIVSDPETEELLVRAFMRVDGVNPKNPKLWGPAMEQANQVLSRRIRRSLALEVARITGEEAPSDTPSDGAYQGAPDGVRAGARAASTSSPTPTTTSAIPSPPAPRDLFERFWTFCPRKIGKDAARKAWKSAIKRGDPEAIVDGMRRFARLNLETEPKFIPHPATWLNAGRWLDEASALELIADPGFKGFVPTDGVSPDPDEFDLFAGSR